MLRYIRLIGILFVITVIGAMLCYFIAKNDMLTKHERHLSKTETETAGKITVAISEKANVTTEKQKVKEQNEASTRQVPIQKIEIRPSEKTPFYSQTDRNEINVKKGTAFYLKTKIKPKNATAPIQWICDQEDVIKVMEDGKVCAMNVGTAVLTAKSSDVEKAEASITVNVKSIDRKDAVLVAHRGKCDVAPENSLSAIELALQEGNVDVEFDVWETLDHQFVVSHDESLIGCCGVDVKVTELSLEEAMRYHITKGNQVNEYSDETIPSLKQVLEVAQEYKGDLHVELKQELSKKMLRKLRKSIHKYGLENQVKIITFSRNNITKMRELDEEEGSVIRMEYLSSACDEAVMDFCVSNKVDLGIQHTHVNTEVVQRCHELGIAVNVWTVNDFEEAYKMVYDYKVDAVTSDYFLFE